MGKGLDDVGLDDVVDNEHMIRKTTSDRIY